MGASQPRLRPVFVYSTLCTPNSSVSTPQATDCHHGAGDSETRPDANIPLQKTNKETLSGVRNIGVLNTYLHDHLRTPASQLI